MKWINLMNDIDFKIGYKHYYLTIIEQISDAKFKCKCDCGKELTLTKSKLLNDNKSCGCKRLEYRRKSIENNLYPKKGLYTYYKINAKRRNVEFNISLEDFSSLIEGKCYYCKSSKQSKIKFSKKKDKNQRFYNYTGVDRINNNLGYSKENCVTCCKTCNCSKLDLSLSDWFIWINDVYNHFILKNKGDEINSPPLNETT